MIESIYYHFYTKGLHRLGSSICDDICPMTNLSIRYDCLSCLRKVTQYVISFMFRCLFQNLVDKIDQFPLNIMVIWKMIVVAQNTNRGNVSMICIQLFVMTQARNE
jgi:hypothetical protein